MRRVHIAALAAVTATAALAGAVAAARTSDLGPYRHPPRAVASAGRMGRLDHLSDRLDDALAARPPGLPPLPPVAPPPAAPATPPVRSTPARRAAVPVAGAPAPVATRHRPARRHRAVHAPPATSQPAPAAEPAHTDPAVPAPSAEGPDARVETRGDAAPTRDPFRDGDADRGDRDRRGRDRGE